MMMCWEAQRLPLEFVFHDDPSAPAATCGRPAADPFEEVDRADVVTFEFENVDLKVAEYAELKGKLKPPLAYLAVKKGRIAERKLFQSLGIPTASWRIARDGREALEIAKSMALTAAELEAIRRGLGRGPTPVELALFTAHWSEHCAYKSTRGRLSRLPSKAPWVVKGPGTDAPLVEVAPGLYVTFKIESHNHPSAVDPYNGAATGVGGIIRDILTVGAKPIALLVNLHFGPPQDAHAKWIAQGVVRGISDYGNRVGVPVVGGETWFDEDFTYTPIVLATCVGVVSAEDVPRGGVEAGDLFIVVGSGADKSGLGGSAFASKTLTEEEDLGAVQVADPLMRRTNTAKSTSESTIFKTT